MHVALLSPAWPLEIYPNGIVTYVHWLRLELLRRGHAVTVITGTLAPDCRDPGVEPIVTSVPFRTMAWVRARSPWMDSPIFSWGQAIARTLMQIHRRSPIDVVEMEESFGWFADVQRRTGLPVVVKL
ncbi:MAG TPA: glycosyltransferase, partial [Roseateles sp.]